MVCGQTHYFASALTRPDWPNASPVERRVRNWVHDKVLSGDTIVEQNVHIIDMTNWLLKTHPLKAVGRAGAPAAPIRATRRATSTWSSPIRVTSTSAWRRRSSASPRGASRCRYYGTKGSAQARYDAPVRISGETKWEFPGLGRPVATDQAAAATGVFRGALEDSDENKQKVFIESITGGAPLNEVGFGSESTLTGILGRMAAYTGKEVTWEAMMKSKDVSDPKIDFKQFT